MKATVQTIKTVKVKLTFTEAQFLRHMLKEYSCKDSAGALTLAKDLGTALNCALLPHEKKQ